MKRILIILILILTFVTTCRLVHLFEDENSVITTTTQSSTIKRSKIYLIDETNRIIPSDSTKNLGLIPLGNLININLKIRNGGNDILKINNVSILDKINCSNVSYNLSKTELNSYEETNFTISTKFDNTGDGSFRIEILSNDPNMPVFRVKFIGNVVNAIYVSEKTGDDSTGTGTMTSPYKTITKGLENLQNAGGLICVAAGSYTEDINMYGIHIASLYGGYYCDGATVDWNNRNIFSSEPNYITSISPASFYMPPISIMSNSGVPVDIEGFTINGSNSSPSEITTIYISYNCQNIVIKNNNISCGDSSGNIYGIKIESSNFIHIINNSITINKITTETCAIYNWNSSDIEIIDNRIQQITNPNDDNISFCGIRNNGGNNISIRNNNIQLPNLSEAGSSVNGIWLENASDMFIFNNRIENGESPEESSAIYLNNITNAQIADNIINTKTYIGIDINITANCDFNIRNNTIVLDTATDDVTGIYIENISGSIFNLNCYNNVLYIKNGNNKNGISLEHTNNNVKIINNTIVMNNSIFNKGINLIDNDSPLIENNIIFLNNINGINSDNEFAIYETASSSNPETILNNDVFGFKYFYYDFNAPMDERKIASLNDFNKSEKTNQKGVDTVKDNKSANPKFFNINDPINHGLKLQISSPQDVKQGGKSQVFLNNDRIYRPRTMPWSIGAYECDE